MEKLFTKKEAANYMKVSERTVSRMIKSMSLRIYRVGRQVRIPATSINKMLKGASIVNVRKMTQGELNAHYWDDNRGFNPVYVIELDNGISLYRV